MQFKANEEALIGTGIAPKRVQAMQTDLQHRIGAVRDGALAWGAFTVRKPANSHTLVVGGGPLGAFVAMHMSQSGVSNVTLKVCMLLMHTCRHCVRASALCLDPRAPALGPGPNGGFQQSSTRLCMAKAPALAAAVLCVLAACSKALLLQCGPCNAVLLLIGTALRDQGPENCCLAVLIKHWKLLRCSDYQALDTNASRA
jgi:hypothetical protein